MKKRKKRSFEEFRTRIASMGLMGPIESRALKLHVSLHDLYSGTGRTAPSVIAARRVVYSWLESKGKTRHEIAKLFDRSPSGVIKLMAGDL